MNLQSLAPRLFASSGHGPNALQRFWKWWSGEILDFVPASIRAAFDHDEQLLLISVHERDMTLERRHGADRQPLETIALADDDDALADKSKAESPITTTESDRIVVELSRAQAVQRQVALPFGTEDRIEDVLGYEMDRFTPYARNDVYIHYRVTGRDNERRVINIHLVVALRKTVDGILAALKKRGVNPSRVTLRGCAESTDPAMAAINLLPRNSRAKPASRRNLVPTALTALAAILAVVAIGYPFANQLAQLNRLDDEIAALSPAAIAAGKTRDEIANAVRLAGFFSDKRAVVPTQISLLNELTRVIPDDTWLSRVQVQGTTVRVHGESEGASSLIGLIEDSDMLRDVRFSSPVTKNPRTSNDRFVIEAQIETAGGSSE